MGRAQWRLDSDKQAMLEGTFERAKQQEQEMESLWMEQLETEAKNKQAATQATSFVARLHRRMPCVGHRTAAKRGTGF